MAGLEQIEVHSRVGRFSMLTATAAIDYIPELLGSLAECQTRTFHLLDPPTSQEVPQLWPIQAPRPLIHLVSFPRVTPSTVAESVRT